MNDGQRITIRPARAGLVLRDPDTRLAIPEQGVEVTLTPYWRRRVEQGDAQIAELQADLSVHPRADSTSTRRGKGS